MLLQLLKCIAMPKASMHLTARRVAGAQMLSAATLNFVMYLKEVHDMIAVELLNFLSGPEQAAYFVWHWYAHHLAKLVLLVQLVISGCLCLLAAACSAYIKCGGYQLWASFAVNMLWVSAVGLLWLLAAACSAYEVSLALPISCRLLCLSAAVCSAYQLTFALLISCSLLCLLSCSLCLLNSG